MCDGEDDAGPMLATAEAPPESVLVAVVRPCTALSRQPRIVLHAAFLATTCSPRQNARPYHCPPVRWIFGVVNGHSLGKVNENKRDTGNGSKVICHMNQVLRPPSPDPPAPAFDLRSYPTAAARSQRDLSAGSVSCAAISSSCRIDQSKGLSAGEPHDRRYTLAVCRMELLFFDVAVFFFMAFSR